VCERSSQNGPWRFGCSNFTSKHVVYVVHVVVKRSKTFKNPTYLFSSLWEFRVSMVIFEPRTPGPHLSMLTKGLLRHLSYLWEIWNLYQKKKISRNFKNPKKFWKSEKNWNSRFQNFAKIDLIILPNWSNWSNRKKSLNRLDVDFLKESRWLYDELNRIGCRDGLSFLLTLMVTDYKQVMRDRTTGSQMFGAGMKDVTDWSVQRFRNPWPNKVLKDCRRAGVK